MLLLYSPSLIKWYNAFWLARDLLTIADNRDMYVLLS